MLREKVKLTVSVSEDSCPNSIEALLQQWQSSPPILIDLALSLQETMVVLSMACLSELLITSPGSTQPFSSQREVFDVQAL